MTSHAKPSHPPAAATAHRAAPHGKPARDDRQGRERPRESAGAHVTPAVPRAHEAQTAAAVVAELVTQRHECVDVVCVLDDGDRLVGILTLPDLLALPGDTPVGIAANRHFPKVHPDTDQERVASLALHHMISAVPVIDDKGRLFGVVPSTTLLHILRREHVEDVHRIAGISRETARAREAIEEPPMRRLRHRLPWLLLGLLGSMLATFIVARFEALLAARPSIAFFVPGLVYLADAIGTQTEAIAVRGISLSHSKLSSLAAGELRTGLLIGLVLGALTFPAVWLVFGDLNLAIAVAGSLVVAGAIATSVGMLLPWLLQRLGSDPAYGSGPLATIIQDLLSLATYFLIVGAVVL